MRKLFFFSILFFLFMAFLAADVLLGILPCKAETVEIPFLVGQNFDFISQALSALPFDVETELVYDDSAKGTILSQNPTAGVEKVLSDRPAPVLHLTVSMGLAPAEP